MLFKNKLILLLVLFMFAMTPHLKASVGLRIGSYTDADELFVGGEFNTRIAHRTYLNPNLEYVLVDNGTYMTINLDIHYDLLESRATYVWAGGGLALQYFDWEGDNNSNTEMGINLLAGVGLKTSGRVMPYIQGKIILGDADDFVLGLGIRF